MVGHQDVGVEHKRMTLDHLAEKCLEALVIHVVIANLLALATPADDVAESAVKVYARASWHVGFLAQEDFNKQISKARYHYITRITRVFFSPLPAGLSRGSFHPVPKIVIAAFGIPIVNEEKSTKSMVRTASKIVSDLRQWH